MHGMVGSAIRRRLQELGYTNITGPTSAELDLKDQQAVLRFFEKERPVHVLVAAARVGGILANDQYKATFLYDNLMIQSNVIHTAYLHGVKKLLFLGSSCIYPKHAPQPLKEEYLLTGLLEPTNEPYAIAKIAGIKLCDAYRYQYGCHFISAMPANLYGPGDHYDLQRSHVLPALLKKIHLAKLYHEPRVEIWGTGQPLREFLHVDDLADALILLMQQYDEPGFVNIGSGREISIFELAQLMKEVVHYTGEFYFDAGKPDGTPRKLLDSSKMHAMGWAPRIDLREGIEKLYGELVNSNRWIGERS